MKFKKNTQKWLLAAFAASVFAAICLSLIFQHAKKSSEKIFESINTVSQMDSQYGKPLYVLKKYPTVVWDHYITEVEMKNGIILSVYVIRKFPSSLLSLVKHKNGQDQILDKTTYVP